MITVKCVFIQKGFVDLQTQCTVAIILF